MKCYFSSDKLEFINFRSNDYENFISTLLLKSNARSCAFAVRSFNVEVAKVAQQVSTKDTGLMRLQFWEDTLEKCFLKEFDKVPKHPVAIELFKVSKPFFHKQIDLWRK